MLKKAQLLTHTYLIVIKLSAVEFSESGEITTTSDLAVASGVVICFNSLILAVQRLFAFKGTEVQKQAT